MNKLPISLCIFSSTRGHHGRTDLHLATMRELDKLVPLYYFNQRLAHIKVLPGENSELVYKQMRQDFHCYNVTVEPTVGYWKHFDQSHNVEYLKDIIKTSALLTSKYTLFLEDDWVFLPKNGQFLLELFKKAVELLENDLNVLSVRFPRHMDDSAHVHGIPYNDLYNKNGFIYSFNPHICRTRDLYIASSIVSNNFDNFSYHCEHGFTRAAKILSRSDMPFYAFRPEIVQAYHIGEPPFNDNIPKEFLG